MWSIKLYLSLPWALVSASQFQTSQHFRGSNNMLRNNMLPQQATTNTNDIDDQVASLTNLANAFKSKEEVPIAAPKLYQELSSSVAAVPSMRMLATKQTLPPSSLSQPPPLHINTPKSPPSISTSKSTSSPLPLDQRFPSKKNSPAKERALPTNAKIAPESGTTDGKGTPPLKMPRDTSRPSGDPKSRSTDASEPQRFADGLGVSKYLGKDKTPQVDPKKSPPPLPSTLESYTRRMRKSAYLAQLLGLQADSSQSRAMSSLLRDAALQENVVLERTSRPWIPGLDLIGLTTDMYEGKYISTALTPNTRVIHDPTEGEFYKKYQIPSALQVVEKSTVTSDGTWTVDYVTDTMRRRLSTQWGYHNPSK